MAYFFMDHRVSQIMCACYLLVHMSRVVQMQYMVLYNRLYHCMAHYYIYSVLLILYSALALMRVWGLSVQLYWVMAINKTNFVYSI